MMEIWKFSISILYLTDCMGLGKRDKKVIEWEREREKEKRERIIAGPKIPKSVGGRLFSGLCAFFNYIRITNAHTNKHTHTHTHKQTHTHTYTHIHTCTHVDKSLIPHLGICIINVHISYIQIYTQIYIYVCICSADYVQKIFAEVLSQNRTIF